MNAEKRKENIIINYEKTNGFALSKLLTKPASNGRTKKMRYIWYCVDCGKTEVHDSEETTEEWDNAYPPSVTSEQREYFGSLIDEGEEWDVWGARCTQCKVKDETEFRRLNRIRMKTYRDKKRTRKFSPRNKSKTAT